MNERRLTDEQRDFVANNLGLVHAYVQRRYGANHPNYDDLVQSGIFGLMRAAQRYDPSRAKFSTYATHCIRTRVDRSRLEDTTIRVPVRAAEDARRDRGKFLNDAQTAWRMGRIDIPGNDQLPMGRGPGPSEALEADEEAVKLREALGGLDDRQRAVIERRFFRGQTPTETGVAIGLTRQSVHLIEKAALGRLRRLMK